jgi:hypothetical protein
MMIVAVTLGNIEINHNIKSFFEINKRRTRKDIFLGVQPYVSDVMSGSNISNRPDPDPAPIQNLLKLFFFWTLFISTIQYYNMRIGSGCSVFLRSWWLEPWTLLTGCKQKRCVAQSWRSRILECQVPGSSDIQLVAEDNAATRPGFPWLVVN